MDIKFSFTKIPNSEIVKATIKEYKVNNSAKTFEPRIK